VLLSRSLKRERGAGRSRESGRGGAAILTATSLLLAVIGTSSATGCSVLFTKPVPPRFQRGPELQCTTTFDWPFVDMLVTGVEVGRVGFAVQGAHDWHTDTSLNVALGTSLAILFGTSAVVGVLRVKECHEAWAERQEPPHRHSRPLPLALPAKAAPAPDASPPPAQAPGEPVAAPATPSPPAPSSPPAVPQVPDSE